LRGRFAARQHVNDQGGGGRVVAHGGHLLIPFNQGRPQGGFQHLRLGHRIVRLGHAVRDRMAGEFLALFGRQLADAMSHATADGNLFEDRPVSETEFEAFHSGRWSCCINLATFQVKPAKIAKKRGHSRSNVRFYLNNWQNSHENIPLLPGGLGRLTLTIGSNQFLFPMIRRDLGRISRNQQRSLPNRPWSVADQGRFRKNLPRLAAKDQGFPAKQCQSAGFLRVSAANDGNKNGLLSKSAGNLGLFLDEQTKETVIFTVRLSRDLAGDATCATASACGWSLLAGCRRRNRE
jgi:hypothetical protein